jgi:HK97 family phage prohead protease
MTTTDTKAPIEVRTAPLELVDVRERIIELVAVPYDEWTPVEYRGRLIEESFAPGAFGRVDERIAKRNLLVNLEHDRAQWVGKVLRVDPDDPHGLRAELRIRRGVPFDQVLDDAADGMLAASVGFAARPENQEWENRDRRRIREAFLDHVALTATPAYAGATVLDVRAVIAPAEGGPPTPNLDQVRALHAEQEYRLSLLNAER